MCLAKACHSMKVSFGSPQWNYMPELWDNCKKSNVLLWFYLRLTGHYWKLLCSLVLCLTLVTGSIPEPWGMVGRAGHWEGKVGRHHPAGNSVPCLPSRCSALLSCVRCALVAPLRLQEWPQHWTGNRKGKCKVPTWICHLLNNHHCT